MIKLIKRFWRWLTNYYVIKTLEFHPEAQEILREVLRKEQLKDLIFTKENPWADMMNSCSYGKEILQNDEIHRLCDEIEKEKTINFPNKS
jgi:hypothetical protein